MNTRKNTKILHYELGYSCRFVFRFALFRMSLVFLFVLISVIAPLAQAAEQLILTVTPPLFQLNIGPGEFWASSVKIVNVNPYDLTLYTLTMNFEASGEAGQGKFTPILQKEGEIVPNTLAQWIEIEPGPFFVPREKSVEVPFSVRIPTDAPPGGHYAAILVGTQPPRETVEGASISVSSFVSSLIFVRIKGEVKEDGGIREFFTDRAFYQKPEVAFTLRFENKGNVHLQPQGDITIYNMWGKERGKILINHKTHFGNVLPKSIRKFEFKWQGESSPFEVGRYRAVATLTYGTEVRQNISATTYFWVVPLAAMLGVLGGLILIFLVSWFAIRAYIRRAIVLYQKELVVPAPSAAYPPRIWLKPVIDGVVDLKAIMRERSMRGAEVHEVGKKKFSAGLFQFLNAYRRFFSYLAFFVLAIAAVIFYVREVRLPERNFEIVIPRDNTLMDTNGH